MYSIPFVVLLGMGIVFVGLVSIIFLTMLMHYILKEREEIKKSEHLSERGSEEIQIQEMESNLEFIMAVFTVLSDDLHMDLSNTRITVEKA